MTVDERARHELFLAAEHSLGRQQSETLMEMLPPVGWADVATKHDLDALEARLASRIDAQFAAVDAQFAAVEGRFAAVDGRFAAVDAQFESGFALVDSRFEMLEQQLAVQKAEILGAMYGALNAQTKTLFFGIITVLTSIAAIAIALVR